MIFLDLIIIVLFFVNVNIHTYTREKYFEKLYLLVNIIRTVHLKNNIFSIKMKDEAMLARVVLTQLSPSKQPSNFLMYIPKRIGYKGQHFLTHILQLISSNQ